MNTLTFDQAYVGVAMMLTTLKRWVSQDDGVDDSPAKLIYIAIAIALAVAASAFAITVFNDAKEGVPDPVAPAPAGP